MIGWGFLYNISDCKIYADLLSFVIRSAYRFSKVPRKLKDMLQLPSKPLAAKTRVQIAQNRK